MLADYSIRKFLMWIVCIVAVAMIAMFGVIYAVDILVVPTNASLKTQVILKK
jgi:hypothetical protein